MAIANNVVYNIQADGSGLNGGGYVENVAYASQVDYSQQAAAQLSITDGASVDGSAVLTSATGGFTAAMEGNIVCISSGTNHILGFYEIVAYSDTNTVTLDRDCATGGDMSSAVCKIGGAWNFDETSMYTAFFSSTTMPSAPSGPVTPRLYIKAGSYTLLANVTVSSAASSAARIRFIGYNSTFGDDPTGTDRPLVDCDTYYVTDTSGYKTWENLRFTGTTNPTFMYPKTYSAFVNCLFTSTGSQSYTVYCTSAGGAKFVGCEFTGNASYGIYLTSSTSVVFLGCYFHDIATGLYSPANTIHEITGCVFDTCSTKGCDVSTIYNIVNNTFYNCGTGFEGDTLSYIVANNLFHSCTVGVNIAQNYGGYSLVTNTAWYNNGTDITGNGDWWNSPRDITADPLLNDPANGDFTLQDGSPAVGTGADANMAGATV